MGAPLDLGPGTVGLLASLEKPDPLANRPLDLFASHVASDRGWAQGRIDDERQPHHPDPVPATRRA